MTETILAKFTSAKGEPVDATVSQVRFDTDCALVILVVEAGTAPRLPMGTRLSVSFSSPVLSRPFMGVGRIVSETRREERTRYGLQVDLEQGSLLCPALNRREAFRVHPSASAPVAAHLAGREGPIEASVFDLSEGGVALLVPEQHEIEVFDRPKVELALELPGTERLSFVGSVRHRDLRGEAVQYGIEFDVAETAEFGDKQKAIHAYVVRRQVEMIRALRAQRKRRLGVEGPRAAG